AVRGSRVGMAIEQRARDPAGKRSLERFMELLSVPGRHNVVTADAALDPQAPVVLGTASKARAIRRVPVLQGLHHGTRLIGTIGACAKRGGAKASSTRSTPAPSRIRTGTALGICPASPHASII